VNIVGINFFNYYGRSTRSVEHPDSRPLVLSPKTTKADLAISFCTDSGKLIEHIYGFLMIVERILQNMMREIQTTK